jgi:hypothetical protein
VNRIIFFVFAICGIVMGDVKGKRAVITTDLEYYKQFEGVYTLDLRTTISEVGGVMYIYLILIGSDGREVRYYERIKERGVLWNVKEFKVTVQPMDDESSPSCDSDTEVIIQGLSGGKVIYEKIDIFDHYGRSKFPLFPESKVPSKKPEPRQEDKKKLIKGGGARALVMLHSSRIPTTVGIFLLPQGNPRASYHS